MTASLHAGKHATTDARLRRVAANLKAWLALIVRPRRFKSGRLLPPRRRLVLGGLAGIAFVAFCMIVLDARGVSFAATLPLWVVETFNEITDYGRSGWTLIPIGCLIALAAILCTPSAGRMTARVLTSLVVRLEFLFLAIALPSLFVTIVKGFIGRLRPSELGPFVYSPWSWQHKFASMPSGHSAAAFAFAVAVSLVWPRARVPVWIFAAVIGASRVIIQAHFVSDVFSAFFVGGFGAILVRNWFAARGLAFLPGRDGAVRAMPGPSWRRVKTVARRLSGQ
jgi:membrane-associated phospholipid phosphatase